MSEGHLHKRLVQSLLVHLRNKGGKWFLFVDGDDTHSSGCPPQLELVRPDLYARENESRHVVIGEAKIATDIENDHTALQLATYFEHLAGEQSSELIIAVPYLSAGLAYRICRSLRRKVACEQIPFEIGGWLYGPATYSQFWRG